MKLEVGMYVRTKDGISKIVNIFFEKTGIFIETDNGLGNCSMSTRGKLHKGIYIFEEDYKKFIENNVKSAIIDLIEAGDYVNGSKLLAIDYAEDREGNCDKAHFYYSFEDCEKDINEYYENLIIETIVTKEQFESMSYKL